ncbi:MAG: YqeG family HAD IIIA-type phosphatase [Lachnospiraceae bacterium]|nr:YqeG family HAD IIIA-type phosphatase [Lachnospiraceae bacterium]
MFNKFYPDKYYDSTYVIDFEKEYNEGFRGVIFDIDNTLVEHDADADERAIKFMERLKKIGFNVCLLSNNKRERVERFNKDVDVNYIFKANKPSRQGYRKAMEIMGTNENTTLFVGDQLFTDVYGARRTGIKSYLVKPIDKKEEIQIVLKRYLEKIVLYFYNKSLNK